MIILKKETNQKAVQYLGWVATAMSIMMYVSYIAQIQENLAGHKGAFLQPLVACINCILWTIYALCSKPKNLPLAAANIPGIILGFITALTSF